MPVSSLLVAALTRMPTLSSSPKRRPMSMWTFAPPWSLTVVVIDVTGVGPARLVTKLTMPDGGTMP
ncbi:hypothetical protein ACFJIX_12635 [Roseateles sp. UC29_93]|uniref:hypothetical protein n=1 Tax=Roseateles sp. UC29_93 TaxID=3350177 RepID=UPI00366F73C7